jgi:predicted DNA-binding transcriptional regulator AlpA
MHTKRNGKRQLRRTNFASLVARPIAPADSVKSPATQPARSADIEPLLDDHDLEQITGRARSTWQKSRLTGEGPPFIRLGRLVRYRRGDFERWLAAHASLRSTSEKAA